MKKSRKVVINIAIVAVLLTMLLSLAGCSGLPSNAKKAVNNSVKNWNEAVEKTATDTYTITNLKISATAMGLPVDAVTVSATVQLTRTFTETSTKVDAKVTVQGLKINDVVLGFLEGVTLNQSKAKNLVLNASIELKDDAITIKATSEGLREFVVKPVQTSELNVTESLAVSEYPAIATLMKDSLDILSVGEIPDTGKVYQDEKKYLYDLPAASAVGEMSKQFSVIFDAVKGMKVDGDKTIGSYVDGIFGTTNLISVLSNIITGYEMPVRVTFNDDDKKYYISELTTYSHINGKIVEADIMRALKYFGMSDSDIYGIADTLDFSKGIRLSTSNDRGLQLKSEYSITKFGK